MNDGEGKRRNVDKPVNSKKGNFTAKVGILFLYFLTSVAVVVETVTTVVCSVT